MSFTGDLEHLPIVDVIQLLHSTRKSGILRVNGRKGESQLVFKDGYIVSASHLNNSVRIGKILIDQKVITQEVLDQVLDDQRTAGHERKPLIVTLIEKGLVNEREAYKGLEHLIEMTIVEILTWKRGTFNLDIQKETSVSDEYRYYPQKIGQEINVDTQSVLMDALRVFDEKIRDGELQEEDLADEEFVTGQAEDSVPALTADDLGLTELDQLEKTIPGVFTTLEDLDPAVILQQKIVELAPGFSGTEQEQLRRFLLQFLPDSGDRRGKPRPGDDGAGEILLVSRDELLTYTITLVCRQNDIMVHASRDTEAAERLLRLSLSRQTAPVCVIDTPATADNNIQAITELRRLLESKYPRIPLIQLVSPLAYEFSLQSLHDGVQTIFPRPVREERETDFVTDFIRFIEAFRSYVQKTIAKQCPLSATKLPGYIARLRDLREAPEVAFALLQAMVMVCSRAITLVVGQGELIAEKGIGVKADHGREVTPALGFRIPLDKPSVFQRVVANGQLFHGASDQVVGEHLFAAIGAPRCETILLLPMRSRGKTVALTYGDFGVDEPQPVPIELLEILTCQAELVLDNAFFRKKLEKAGA